MYSDLIKSINTELGRLYANDTEPQNIHEANANIQIYKVTCYPHSDTNIPEEGSIDSQFPSCNVSLRPQLSIKPTAIRFSSGYFILGS